MDNFGEILQERVLELDSKVLNKIARDKSHMQALLKKGFGHLLGCSDLEIKSVIEAQQVNFLPFTYREFLNRMGKGAGWTLFGGADYRLDSLKVLKKRLRGSFLNLNNFPEDAFVFLSYQDTAYYYFLTKSEDNDPPVYQFLENSQEITMQSENISTWVFEKIDEALLID